MHHVHVLGVDAELLGHDLGERRLVPLSLGLHRDPQHRRPGRVHAQLAAVGHAEAEHVHVLARPGADGLGEEGDADPHQALPTLRAGGAARGLLGSQLVVPGDPQRLLHGRRVVARVVDPPGAGRVRELVAADEVAQPQLDRVDAELVGEQVDHPLDEVDGLGDAERAGVGDPAGCLVGVHGGHRAVRRLDVVAAGEDAEEAAGELPRRGGAVERTVVGEHVAAQREDPPVPGRGDLALHHVVAGEPGGHEVLGPVLGPLHRPAGEHRADDRADVAGVDRHLVAEAAADVRRDHPDPVLGDAGEHRVQRAVRVRCLGGRPEGELLLDPVVVGDRPAGLQRRRVHAWEHHLLADDDLGPVEHRRGGRRVAGLPVEAVVVGLARDVVADERRVRVERPAYVDDRREHVILDVDQLQRVARGVPVLGDDERDLLALEPDLVGREHGLHVAGERGHPGQAALLEHRAGDHRLDLRVRFRGERVDGDDPGVRHRRPQHGEVQHARQRDVVEVPSAAAHEPPVLLAEHPAVPDGPTVDRRHASILPSGWSAAQRTLRTMDA